MLKTLILICSVSVAPADCKTETAIDVISGPDATNEVACMFHSQAYIAGTSALAPREGEYMKVTCSRSRPSDTAAGTADVVSAERLP
ncbi:hypothetical protein [Allomesorhizobium alhagi]|uniref:Uncharacterized protein n=1 Tax=Mesorhizobium alhagi CCNWXJ12-2 TaxID=1107882 RepID=H0HWY9_9HYPH|nr:hypothetical protein [Mesorhizobium alhagi]EHK54750.1 hypothetical protein MAXJ12_23532 [Mesorhizobium alhagi CCNWXJ12-2]